MLSPLNKYVEHQRLPVAAKTEDSEDRQGLPSRDPGIDNVVRACIQWIYDAQDHSASQDGGVARHFSLLNGWSVSYPETTGYIVPTLLDWHRRTDDQDAITRSRRMLDWFLQIQFPEGGFQGGMIDARPKVPVTFNTGQILLGLAGGAATLRDSTYLQAMHGAAGWLRDSQEDDGAWRRYPTPFANSGEKAYETHVAWGLLEADRVAPGNGYADAALANMRWGLTKQHSNGWFADNCLTDPRNPLTHTIGYVLRGILEGWRFSRDEVFLNAARLTANALVDVVSPVGYLPGRLNSGWKPACKWVCLTGSSQIAYCMLILYQDTQDDRYLGAGRALNQFVRKTVKQGVEVGQNGGVKGSYPVSGDYGRFEYLNWAAKFTVDANMLEKDIATNNPLRSYSCVIPCRST